MKLSLIVVNGSHAGRVIPVKGSKFSIGRSHDCHMRLGSDRISRHHCVLLVEAEQVVVRDLGSRNGTFVNGQKIDADRPLENADRLMIGHLELEVRAAAAAKATADASQGPAADSQSMAALSDTAVTKPAKASKAAGSPAAPSDDDLELTARPAKRPASSDMPAEKPTQVVKPGEVRPVSAKPSPAETAEKPKTKEEDHRSDHIVSEEEKEKARNTRAIVGVSKAAQAKRVTGTSSGAAAEALRRFRR